MFSIFNSDVITQNLGNYGTDMTISPTALNQSGGVCAYVRKTIKYHVLENLFDASFEVLWLTLRPSRLPRGITNVIVGIMYHPPSADDPSMIHYLHESLTSIESQFPNSGTILLGDFNKLKVSRIKNAFNLKQIIKFPTRGGNILDLASDDGPRQILR